MNNEMRAQIYNELNLRETEDLLEIWYVNDHEEWSVTAFEVVKEILVQRLGEIPPRHDTVDEPDLVEQKTEEDDALEEWEAKILDAQDQPEFYDSLEVITLKDDINKVSKVVIAVYVLINLLNIGYYKSLIGTYFPNLEVFTSPIYVLAFILACLNAAISIVIVYFPLKALTQILRVLMEMEFRSRKAI